MTKIILSDLDSTVCDTRQRHHLAPVDRGPTDNWLEFSMAAGDDAPASGVLQLLHILQESYPVYYVSGRSHEAMSVTTHWLEKHGLVYESVRLHRPGDPHDNAEYKVQYVAQLREEGLEPVLMLEDWPSVAAAMESIGVPTVLVNPNYEDTVMADFARHYETKAQ